MPKVSEKLKIAVKTSILNQYTIARESGLSQSMLSQLLNEIVTPRENDPRVLSVGKVLGLKPEDCFE